jgi:hypothetical protein
MALRMEDGSPDFGGGPMSSLSCLSLDYVAAAVFVCRVELPSKRDCRRQRG